jgi:hypothetical protein
MLGLGRCQLKMITRTEQFVATDTDEVRRTCATREPRIANTMVNGPEQTR